MNNDEKVILDLIMYYYFDKQYMQKGEFEQALFHLRNGRNPLRYDRVMLGTKRKYALSSAVYNPGSKEDIMLEFDNTCLNCDNELISDREKSKGVCMDHLVRRITA